MMRVNAHNSSTYTTSVHQGAPLLHQAAYMPAPELPPPGSHPVPSKPPTVGPQITDGSSVIGRVPMFVRPPLTSNSDGAVGGPPLPVTPAATHIDSSMRPGPIPDGQSPVVGPPPKSVFVRK